MIDHITQQTYDTIAPEFSRINATIPQNLLSAMQRFIALVGDSAPVLDLGCGAGRDSAYIQSCGLRVVSADFSAGMLSQAKRIGVKNLAQMDMLRIGFPDDCFNGVWCNASLSHLPKQLVPRVLAEIHRILTPKGILFISVQEGTTEGYEPNPYKQSSLERFFARYTFDEIQSLLCASHFALIESKVLVAVNKRWVRVLASA